MHMCQSVYSEFYPHSTLCALTFSFIYNLLNYFLLIFLVELALFKAMSREDPLLQLWEEAETKLSSDSAMMMTWIHV